MAKGLDGFGFPFSLLLLLGGGRVECGRDGGRSTGGGRVGERGAREKRERVAHLVLLRLCSCLVVDGCVDRDRNGNRAGS